MSRPLIVVILTGFLAGFTVGSRRDTGRYERHDNIPKQQASAHSTEAVRLTGPPSSTEPTKRKTDSPMEDRVWTAFRKLSGDFQKALTALRSWSDDDVRMIANWAITKGCRERTSTSGADVAIAAWAERDFAAALTAARGVESPNCLGLFLGTLAGILANDDLAGALSILHHQLPRSELPSAEARMMEVWGSRDPHAAVLAAFQHPDLRGRSNVLAWAAVAASRTLSLDQLVALAQETGNPAALRILLRQGIAGAARKDPFATWQWYQNYSAGNLDPEFSITIFQGWHAKDTAAAFKTLFSLPDLAHQRALLMGWAMSWNRSSEKLPTEARILLQGADPTLRPLIFDLLAKQMREAPAAIQQAVLNLPISPEEKAVLWASASVPPEEVLPQIDQLGTEEQRQAALLQVSRSYATHDARKAQTWVEAMPASPARDWSVMGLVTTLAQKQPTSATAMLPLFSNAIAKQAAIQTIAVQMWRRSPTEAQAWLSTQTGFDAAAIADALAHGSPSGFFKPDGTWTSGSSLRK